MNTTNISLNDKVFTTIEEKRAFLRKLSEAVASLVDSGEYENINKAVVATFYHDNEHTEFKTFNEWKAQGYSVKKGSKAFLVWAKPKKVQDAETAEEKGEEVVTDDGRDFFPVAFLFSNAQVEIRKGDKKHA